MCGIIGGNWFTSKKQTQTHLQKIIHRGRNASAVEKIDNLDAAQILKLALKFGGKK